MAVFMNICKEILDCGMIFRRDSMIEKQSFSSQDIIDCLNTNYGIAVTALTLLPLGADMQASVYKAETRNATSYFVKLKRGHPFDISVAILALLQESGIQQIIAPIKTIQDELTKSTNDYTLTVYPFVEGQNGFSHHLTDDQWITLGKVLRQVHELDVPPLIKDKIRKETYSPQWREAVRSLYTHMEGNLTGDETTLKLQAFMKKHRAEIHRLVDRAESLIQLIQKQSPEFVLCHSDIHGGNVLINENGAIYIVDWDEPMMAPKERDLMFIGGGVANVWNHPREEEFFYKGYGETHINKILLAYYRFERIVVDIAEYGQALLLTSDGGEDRLEMYQHFVDMFEPNGVVDIAFKTDVRMRYSIETVTPSSQQEMVNFLKEHENSTLFLLGNFENYGATLTEAPYSGNFKLIRSQDGVVGVFCLTRKGNLLIETVLQEPVFDIVVEACRQESLPLRGVVGNWNFCGPFWEYLKTNKIIQKEIFTSKEILYSMDLNKQDFFPQPNVRFLTEADYVLWKPLRLDFLVEAGLPNELTDGQLFDQFLDKAKKKIVWGHFLKNTLVSIADLNAKALDLGQVGGVYTMPRLRQKGYSKSVMNQLLLDAKELHKIRKLIIFTGDNNSPAQKLYNSLGVSREGYFALLFGK